MTARWMPIGKVSQLPDQSELRVIGKLREGSLQSREESDPPGCRINWKNYGYTLTVDCEKHKATDLCGVDPRYPGEFGMVKYDKIEVFIGAPEGKRRGRVSDYDYQEMEQRLAKYVEEHGWPDTQAWLRDTLGELCGGELREGRPKIKLPGKTQLKDFISRFWTRRSQTS